MSKTPTATLPYPLLGSDFPHPEGLAQSTHFADALGHRPVGNQAKIMGGNLARPVSV
jgi:hypothetical protein